MNERSPEIIARRRAMCERAAARLQAEAYTQQIAGRNKPLKHFSPCERGLIYTAAIGAGNKEPSLVITQNAYFTHCACHSGITERDLMRYEAGK